MPPAVGRMHHSHMSNPFAHLNPQHSIPQSHYQNSQMPNSFNTQAFGNSALNGGISPFNPTSPYGGTAFSAAAGSNTFNGSMLGGQGQGLGSAAAQAGFARGAAMQEHNNAMDVGGVKSGQAARIREVWRHNLDYEFHVLRQLVQKYPFVSMDAEFPGIVARPIGHFAGSKAEYHYQTLRCNVDILKPIQVGITLWTPEGELPPVQDPKISTQPGGKLQYNNNHLLGQTIPCTWVFNFQFSLEEDMYAETSIELLKNSGVDFQRHQDMGITTESFGSLLTTSGLAFSSDINWLSFHSGYDFGYLIKLLSNDALPMEQTQFSELVKTFFPTLWDIKFLLRHAQRVRNNGRLSADGMRIVDALGSKSGLGDLAEELGCQRIGNPHTAGSDAWLTGSVFWAMKNKIFNGELEEELSNQIYGLHGVPAPASQQYRDDFLAAQSTPSGQGVNGATPAAASGLSGLGTVFTPSNQPATPTTQHARLNNQTPGPPGHYGGFGNFTYPK
ncbi:ribonuclease H [Lecanosticta acicola]|uniref:poly(A)-specific ribonuclease n=1 Tax=Lecanosticta acicola TaxID=111012 RepID=A0AAI9E9A3_9PEZI|nr:ribonuclease H [Lecanosticta acicola]